MTHPSSKDLVERLARRLSVRCEYIRYGPYPKVRATLKGNGNVE